jgi:HD-GYP domain-containing protein (c-di-GMP phosphodiesterase class II)
MNSSATIRNKVDKFINQLAKVTQIASIYGDSHRITDEALVNIQTTLDDVFSEMNEFTIGIVGDEIAFEKEPYFDTSQKKKPFIELLKEKKMKKISFSKGVDRNELVEFVTILAQKSLSETKVSDIKEKFLAKEIIHITIGEIGVLEDEFQSQDIQSIEAFTRKTFEEGTQFLENVVDDIKLDKPLNINFMRHIINGLVKSLLINKNLLMMLTSIKLQDENRFVHNLNVCVFTLLQAEMLGLEQEYLLTVATSSLLHNIGSLVKGDQDMGSLSVGSTGKLVSQSAADPSGAKILLETEDIGELAPIVAFEHSIPYSASGYPNKLYGHNLNLISMMVAIASRYDTLRRDPSYYENGGPEKVHYAMMQRSGKDFHPDLLKNFFAALGVYPPGTLVELDSMEIGLVIQGSILDIRRPQIEILYNNNGEKYKNPPIVNLLEKNKKGQFRWTIMKSISPLDRYKIPEKYK